MAEIVAEDDDVLQPTQPETSNEENSVTIEDTLKPVEETTQPAEQPQEQEVPDKYQGKSIQDLVQMHQNAESALGKQSGEVGELRKVVDDFILSQSRTNQQETVPEKDDDTDFFSDPKTAVSKTVAESDVIREMQQELQVSRQERAVNAMLGRHPHIKDTLQDPKFAEWVQSKPYRVALLSKTDQYDLDAADELFSLWGDYSGVEQQAAQKQQQEQRSAAVQKANTGNIQSASAPGKKGPVFRRADIIKLKMEDPDRYEALEDEIMKAYAEKRVI